MSKINKTIHMQFSSLNDFSFVLIFAISCRFSVVFFYFWLFEELGNAFFIITSLRCAKKVNYNLFSVVDRDSSVEKQFAITIV